MNILITSALGENGKSIFKFYRGINTYRADQNLIGIEKSPSCKSINEYHNYLKTRVEALKIDWLIPCSDHDLNFLLNLTDRDMLFSLNIPPYKTLESFATKTTSLKIAQKYFHIPSVEKNHDLFIRNNQSNKRPKIFKKIPYSEISMINKEEFCLTKFIYGEEFSVDSLYLKNRSPQIAIRKRMQIENGISRDAEFINNNKLKSRMKDFILDNQIFGYACTQFILTDSEFYFIECNTRPGGGIGLSFREQQIT